MAGDASTYNRAALRDALPGVAVTLLEQTASTQQHAIDMLEREREGLTLPAVIVAHEQTQGRGRGSNRWRSGDGCVTATFLMTAEHEQTLLELPLRCGLAVRDALSQWISPVKVKIKWPNDVLVDDRKIAGVLCQQVRGVNVIGIGLNVAMDFRAADTSNDDATLAQQATSLHEHVRESEARPGRQDVLIALARAVFSLWEMHDWHARLSQAHALTGRDIVVSTDQGHVAGVCEGVDERGCLLVRTGQRLHTLYDGSIVKHSFTADHDGASRA